MPYIKVKTMLLNIVIYNALFLNSNLISMNFPSELNSEKEADYDQRHNVEFNFDNDMMKQFIRASNVGEKEKSRSFQHPADENIAESFKKMPKLGFSDLTDDIPNKIIKFAAKIKDCTDITSEKNKNIILLGPPGSGKTTIAEAIAKEANIDFYSLKAGTLITSFQGSASSTLDEVFKYIESKKKKAIVFVDEIDAIVNTEINDSNGETIRATRTLQCLLDGEYAISIFATNYPKKLPKPFKTRCIKIKVPLPNQDSVIKFFKKNLEKTQRFTVQDHDLIRAVSDIKEANYRDLQRIAEDVVTIAQDHLECVKKSNNILTYEDYLIAIREVQDYPVIFHDEIKLLFKHYLSQEKLKNNFDEEFFDKLAVEANGLTASEIENAIINAKNLSSKCSTSAVQLEDIYAGIYYDQNKKIVDINTAVIILKHLLHNKPKRKITEYIYNDLGHELINIIASEDIEDFIYNARKLSELRNFKAITPSDLYLGLYQVLEKKANPYLVSVNDNTTYTPFNDSTESFTSGLNGGINLPIPIFNLGGQASASKTTNSTTHKWIPHTTKSTESKEMPEDEKFLKTNVSGDAVNKDVRLDYQTGKLPGYNLRLAVIRYLMKTTAHEMHDEDIKKFAAITHKVSCYTIKELIKIAKEACNKRKNKDQRLFKGSHGLILDDLIKAAKKLNITFNLGEQELKEVSDEEFLKRSAKSKEKPENTFINEDNYSTFKDIISRIHNVDAKNKHCRTLLNKECYLNNFGEKFIKLLLKYNANPNVPDDSGNTPLINVLRSTRFPNEEAINNIIKMLVKNKADVNAKNSSGKTALAYAVSNVNIEAIKMLANAGANVNVQDRQGITPAIIAINQGKIDLLHTLKPLGADFNVKDNNGQNALMHAVKTNWKNNIDFIINGLLFLGNQINLKDNSGYTALMLAASNGYIKAVENLINNKANVNLGTNKECITALMLAVANGHIQVVDALIEAKVNVNATTDKNVTASILAAQNNYLSENKGESAIVMTSILESLIKAGSDINAQDLEGNTALIYAVLCNDLAMVKLLINNKAEANIMNKDKMSALMLAAEYDCNSSESSKINNEIAKVIINCANIDFNIKNNKNLTAKAIALAKDKKEVVKLIDSKTNFCVIS